MLICPADLEKVGSKMLPGHATLLGMMKKEFLCNLLDVALRNKGIHSVQYNLKRLFWFVDYVDMCMLSWKPNQRGKASYACICKQRGK